jgi:Pectate lyase superfamily protein
MARNSTGTISIVVPVEALAAYAFSLADDVAAVSEIPTGGTILQLPSENNSGDSYGWGDVDGSCSSANPLIIAAGEGTTIRGGSSLVTTTAFTAGRVEFDATSDSWIVTELTAATGFNTAPTFFVSLSTLLPTAPRQLQGLDGYDVVGDGGEGWAEWDETSTAAPNGITVAKVASIATGRWRRQQLDYVSLKWAGAKGNNATDDTAAIETAFAAFQAAAHAGTATSLYGPAGTYVWSAPLLLVGLIGAHMFGDGMGQTIFSGTAALHGQDYMLRMTGCSYCNLEDFQFLTVASTTTITAPAAAGATSITVATAAPNGVPLRAGQTIGLKNVNGKGGTSPGQQGESAIIADSYVTGSTTVPLEGPTLYAFLANSIVVCSVRLQLDYRIDDAIGPGPDETYNSTANVATRVQFGSPAENANIAGWGTTCAIGSDNNNDLHKFLHCQNFNGGIAAWFPGHSQSLNHQITACDSLFQMNTIEMPFGGSVVLTGGFVYAYGISTARISGTQEESSVFADFKDESPSRLLQIYGGTGCVAAAVVIDRVDKKIGQPYHLTGTEFTITGENVVGVASLFESELAVNQGVVFDLAQQGVPYTVTSITDNLHCTISPSYTGSSPTTQMGQALSSLVDVDAAQFDVKITNSQLMIGADACTQVLNFVDPSGPNGSNFAFAHCTTGLYGVTLNNVSWVPIDISSEGAGLVITRIGLVQDAFLGNGGLAFGGVGSENGSAFGTYNGQRYAYFGDLPGSAGATSALALGLADPLSPTNWTMIGNDSYSQWAANNALFMIVRNCPAPFGVAFQVSTNGLLLGLPLIGQGINGLAQFQTSIAVGPGAPINIGPSGTNQCVFPQLMISGNLPNDITITVPAGNATWKIVTGADDEFSLELNGHAITFTDGTHSTILNAANLELTMDLIGCATGIIGLALH